MQRLFVVAFAICIVAASIAVGPLATGDPAATVDENADVRLISAPSGEITLERGRLGTHRYHVEAPPVVVDVSNVTGTPILRYVIDIPGAWVTLTSRYGLGGHEGRLQMGASPSTVSPQYIDQRRYNATVAVWLRVGTHEHDLLQRRVTVVVEQ